MDLGRRTDPRPAGRRDGVAGLGGAEGRGLPLWLVGQWLQLKLLITGEQVEAGWPSVRSEQETGRQEPRVPPFLCPDSVLVATGAFLMVRDALRPARGQTAEAPRSERQAESAWATLQGYLDIALTAWTTS